MDRQMDILIRCQALCPPRVISVEPEHFALLLPFPDEELVPRNPSIPPHTHGDPASGRRPLTGSRSGHHLLLSCPGCRPGASLVSFPEVGPEQDALEKHMLCQAPQMPAPGSGTSLTLPSRIRVEDETRTYEGTMPGV